MKKIAVVGTSGSGKTTLASKIAAKLNIKHIELDEVFWLPDWQNKSTEDFTSDTVEALKAPGWVTCGNHSRVREIVWKNADTLIWLNYSFSTTFYRALRRTIQRVTSRKKLFAGNIETYGKAFFSRGSILFWVIKTWKVRREQYPRLLSCDEFSHLNVLEFRSPFEAIELLKKL